MELEADNADDCVSHKIEDADLVNVADSSAAHDDCNRCICGGILSDIHRRVPYYVSDWTDGFDYGINILAPTLYIFFASVVPAFAFGEQIYNETDGIYTISHVLAATSIAGVVQAIIGGQPMLIVGVAEPIVLIYYHIYSYCKSRPELDDLFLPFCTWMLVWTAILQFILSVFNASVYIKKFTRYSGETFGVLIAILFIQAAVKGLTVEFTVPKGIGNESIQVANGIWSICIAIFLILMAITLLNARKWKMFSDRTRCFIADYATTIAFVLATLLSFASSHPSMDIPVRISMGQRYSGSITSSWSTITRMHLVPHRQIVVSIIPAAVITVLFFFDHNVSSQLAQQRDFGLIKGPAYHYDFAIQAINTLLMGLIGLPPTNGVIPQSPMHTRILKGLVNSRSSPVLEQRLTNLLQSLLCGACIFIAPVLRCIPRGALWGYFILMAIESAPGNQFLHRISMIFTGASIRHVNGADYVGRIPYETIMLFTFVQVICLAAVYSITWAGIAGLTFPIIIMLFVPFRQYVFPYLIRREYLKYLDEG